MTELSVALQEHLRKAGIDWNGDLLREGVTLLLRWQIGAERYERTAGRQTYRNGFREGIWETRVGEIPLRIPKLRSGSYYPSFLDPRRRPERALLAVIQAAYVEGVSTRKVDKLVQALGLTGIDKSKVSRICQELDTAVRAFRERPALRAGVPIRVAGRIVPEGAGESPHREQGGGDRHRRSGDRGAGNPGVGDREQ